MPCKSVVAKSTSTINICIRGKTSMGVSSNCMYNNVLMFLFLFINFSFAVDNFSSFQSVSDGTTLVSKNEMFEFGFFSLGSSKNRYVGIWYKSIPVQTVVWVANQCNPVNDSSGLLTINSTGNLVLLYQNKSVVWSTKLSKKVKKPLVQILDSGNLVRKDEEDRNSEDYLWQSFDNPSNTLLPGMKLGWDLRRGLNWRVSVWRNWDDPCPGDFTWGVEFNAKYQASPEAYTWKGGAKYHRSGPWNGLRLSGVPELRPNQLFDFRVVHNEDEVYYLFDLRNDSVNSILVMNQTTSTRERFTWIEAEKRWKLYSSEPRDLCDKYGLCGGNGDCVIGENPVCQCFKGFKPKFEEKWNLTDWSDGCTRSNPLDCTDKSKDGFIKSVGLKMPDIEYSRGNNSMNLKECRAKCLSNCSCMAYANSDIRGDGSGCIMWFGDLMDIRKVPYDEQVLYLRMPASELGKSGPKGRAVIVVVASIGGVAGVLLLGYISYRTKSKAPRENPEETDDLELPLFDLATIAKATNNFSTDNKLGQGGFGPVYKGKLNDGQEIAVKRLSRSSGQGLNEFKNEVILIAKLQHRNLVRLIGYCIQGEEKLLIYEYMPNKSLDFFIFGETRKKLLDWSKRFQIIRGIARGLLYLHQDSRLRIIHRDLKAGNVLLDDELNPKISDFGMAKTFGGNQTEGNTNKVVGTYGYMAPEYASDGLFSIKSDVFSFGILVLEIVSGKKNSGFFHQADSLNLTGHAWRLWNEGNALELIDECLVGSCAESEMLRCIQIGLLCIQHRPEDRPSMSSVVVMFGSQSSLAQPKQPGFFTENAPLKRDVVHSSSSNTQDSSSKNEETVTLLVPR